MPDCGATLIFYREKLLVTANNDMQEDRDLIQQASLKVA
jgi:biotin synthase-like enzyme